MAGSEASSESSNTVREIKEKAATPSSHQQHAPLAERDTPQTIVAAETIPTQLDEKKSDHTSLSNDDDDEKEEKTRKGKKKKKKEPAIPIHRLFRFATKLELLMIGTAAFFSLGVGAMHPLVIVFFGEFMADAGAAFQDIMQGKGSVLDATHDLILIFVYLGTAQLVAAYISQSFWIMTGENQTRRLRRYYVHAILRQDLGWFDMAEEGSLTTRLAADTQLIQDG